MARLVRRVLTAAAAALALSTTAVTPASAAALHLDGPFCETTAFDGVKVTMFCYAQALDGVAPYTYGWDKSKGAAITPLSETSVRVVCTYQTKYRLVVAVRDSAFAQRENDTGWRTCIPIYV